MHMYNKKEKYFNALISGQNGIGKSTLVKTIDPKAKILYINFEKGIDSIENWYSQNLKRVDVLQMDSTWEDVKTLATNDLLTIVNKLKNTNDTKFYDYIFIDSITSLARLLELEARKIKQKDGKEDFSYGDWGLIQQRANSFFYYILNQPCHKIFVGHTETKDNIISLRINGNVFVRNILDDINYSFYLTKNKDNKRVFLTQNCYSFEGNVMLCKKRDEENLLAEEEEASIQHIINKLNFDNNNNKIVITESLINKLTSQKMLTREFFAGYDIQKFDIVSIINTINQNEGLYNKLTQLLTKEIQNV